MIHYRQATREELNIAIRWAAEEGWNPGLGDADSFWAADPEGFVCAERHGEVVATGSIVRYGRTYGFMGFFIVRGDLRGQGIGRDFWRWRRDLLRSRLRSNAPIGMDGVFAMQPFYAKGGFVFSHRNLRMEGIGVGGDVPGLTSLNDLPRDVVEAYDRRHFGFGRENFLSCWLQPQGGASLGKMEGNQLTGMGVIRPCQTGFKIGPLFADSPEIADGLFRGLSARAVGQSVFLDIPENNSHAVSLAARHGLREVFGTARMFHGPPPPVPWGEIYGITSFELG